MRNTSSFYPAYNYIGRILLSKPYIPLCLSYGSGAAYGKIGELNPLCLGPESKHRAASPGLALKCLGVPSMKYCQNSGIEQDQENQRAKDPDLRPFAQVLAAPQTLFQRISKVTPVRKSTKRLTSPKIRKSKLRNVHKYEDPCVHKSGNSQVKLEMCA